MDRINGAGTVDIGGGRQGFRSEDLPTGIEGTEVTAAWLNAVQENILKVIEEAGLVLDVDNWSLLWQALRFNQMADGYFSVTDQRNDPPAGPAAGNRYIVGLAPTGAWVGNENKIALWLGAWTFITPTPWMHVGFSDRTDWRWDHIADPAAWVPWAATGEEASAGLDPRKYVTPLSLLEAQREYIAPHISARAQSGGGYATAVPSGVWTALSVYGFTNTALPGGSTFADGVMTITGEDAGMWLMSLSLYENGLGTAGQATRITLNGVQICSDGAQTTSDTAIGHSASGAGLPLVDGDVVRFEVTHNKGAVVNFDSYALSMVRVSAI